MISRIASRIASSPLSERPDYGSSGASVPRGDVADIVKTRNEDEWCVVSPKNESWSGGCYGSPGAAQHRLEDVEMFKHMNT